HGQRRPDLDPIDLLLASVGATGAASVLEHPPCAGQPYNGVATGNERVRRRDVGLGVTPQGDLHRVAEPVLLAVHADAELRQASWATAHGASCWPGATGSSAATWPSSSCRASSAPTLPCAAGSSPRRGSWPRSSIRTLCRCTTSSNTRGCVCS